MSHHQSISKSVQKSQKYLDINKFIKAYPSLFIFKQLQLRWEYYLNFIIMNEQINKQFPHNKPYVEESQNEKTSSPKPSRKKAADSQGNNSPSNMNGAALAERVQDLEQQLIFLTNALDEEGRESHGWQEQLTIENTKLKELLNDREEQIEGLRDRLQESEAETRLLKDNLFKQNEEMETLHKELQESRLQTSKVQRINGSQLEQKVLELNDQISTLLVKIQQLIEENNQQLIYIEDLQKAVREFKTVHQASETEIQRLNEENHYLKEEIKQVEILSMSQQKEVQNRLLQELQETKEELNDLRKHYENDARSKEKDPVQSKSIENVESVKELTSLRAEIHSLEEEIIQQREVERSLRKKYEERLRASEDQASILSEELSKLKQKNRQLENSCSDHLYALQQIQKEKNRESSSRYGSTDSEHFRNIIVRLQGEKQEIKMKLIRLEACQRHETPTEFYTSAVYEAEAKIGVLREQLSLTEEQLAKSRLSLKETSELARHWEEDYRRLSQQYEEVLRSRSGFQQKNRKDQAELQRHKDIYEQLVTKYDNFEGMYKELEAQVRILQERKGRPFSSDKESRLVKLQNQNLKHEIQQLNARVQELSYQILQKSERPDKILMSELQRFKSREKQMERVIQNLRNRVTVGTNNDNQSIHREKDLNDQLQRVNRMLNQKQMELDSMKQKYEDLHFQFNKKDSTVTLPKHHPQLTRLKSEYVAVQRKLMENQMSAKNSLQNAQYEIQALKIENTHHRKKIEELLKELTSERTSTDYRNLLHSLELSEERNRQLEREVEHCQIKIKDLCDQLRRPSSRERRGSDSRYSRNEYHTRIQQISPRMPSITTPSRTADMFEKQSELNKFPQDLPTSYSPHIQKQNEFSSVYDQLVKERLELRVARSEFQSKWGSLTFNSTNFLQQKDGSLNKFNEGIPT